MSGLTSAVMSSHVHSQEVLFVKLLPSKRSGVHLQRGRGGLYPGHQNRGGPVPVFRAMDKKIVYDLWTIRRLVGVMMEGSHTWPSSSLMIVWNSFTSL